MSGCICISILVEGEFSHAKMALELQAVAFYSLVLQETSFKTSDTIC